MLRTIFTDLCGAASAGSPAPSIAVVLGVAFLAATMVLGATTKAGFADTFTAANDGTDVVVRNATRIGSDESRIRGLIDESMVADVAAVDGVAAAVAEVRGTAQLHRRRRPAGRRRRTPDHRRQLDRRPRAQLARRSPRAALPHAAGEVVIDERHRRTRRPGGRRRHHRAHARTGRP